MAFFNRFFPGHFIRFSLTDLFTAKLSESVSLSNNSLGPAIIPALESLLKSPDKASLDLSGNFIGEGGIAQVLIQKRTTLTRFNFERFGCTTSESFLAVVRRVTADGRIIHSVWPQFDAAQFPDDPAIAATRPDFASKSEEERSSGRTTFHMNVTTPVKRQTRSGKAQQRSPAGTFRGYDGDASRVR
jgi:hypothetical protein